MLDLHAYAALKEKMQTVHETLDKATKALEDLLKLHQATEASKIVPKTLEKPEEDIPF